MDQPPSVGSTESSLYIPPSPNSVTSQKQPNIGRSKKGVVWGIVAGLILALGAGGYFAYSRGYISIPFLSPKSDELFSRLIESLSKIDNAQYTLAASLKSEPRQSGVQSIFPSAAERKTEEQDAQRKSDLAQIRTALVLYADDNTSSYPASIEALAPEYLSKLPKDPKDESVYPYQVCDDGKHYVLYTGLASGEYYYVTDTIDILGTTTKAPKCGTDPSVSSFFWSPLIPVAHAQATTFSVESVGSQIGLGEPSSSLPLVNLFGIFGLADMQEIIDIFPTDIDTSAEITFYTEAEKKLKDADALLKMAATYTGGDLTAQFDVEGRKIGSTVYGIVRKFPGIPYISQYITPLKDKWVKLTPDDGNEFLTDDVWQDTSIKDAVEKTKESLKSVLEGKAFTVDKQMGTDNISGVQSAHYRLAIHPDKFKGIFEKIIADRKSKKLETTELESIVKELDHPNIQATLQRFIDNSTVDIWIDKAQGLLRQVSWNILVVPPEGSTKLKDKQFKLGVTLTLDKVNKKVSVDAPSGSIDYNEAERLVSGISEDEQKFNRQRSRIADIRTALRSIEDLTGSYPDSIDNLQTAWKEAIQDCEDNNKNVNRSSSDYKYCGSTYGSDRSISTTDYYTNKKFEYKSTGTDYTLKYEMHLDFESSDSAFSYGSYYKDDYSEGENTATSIDLSVEKETENEKAAKARATNTNQNRNSSVSTNTNSSTTNYWTAQYPCLTASPTSSVDTDNDGISDYHEVYIYVTSPCSSDTDKDGYTDANEITNGYNPNGSGKQNYGNTNTSFAPTNTSTAAKPVISNIKITFSNGQASATWTTDVPSNTIAYYRNTTKTGDPTHDAYIYNSVTNHQALFPVVIGNTYEYSIASCPGKNDRFSSMTCAQSTTLSFYVSN